MVLYYLHRTKRGVYLHTIASKSIPLYARVSLVSVGIAALAALLYLGQGLLIPLIFAGIIAILLNPIVNFLQNKGWPRIAAISVTVLATILCALGIVYFISSQISMFTDSLPQMKERFNSLTNEALRWLSTRTNIRPQHISSWVSETWNDALKQGGTLGQALTTLGPIVAGLILLPVYIFLMLYYKPLLREFIRKVFSPDQTPVDDVLKNTQVVIQGYLAGMLVEVVIVALLNSLGLLALGIEYAILLGIIGALLNAIPYIGGIIATGMAVMMALVTGDSVTTALLVVVLYAVIQFVDNNFIIPKIVASRVKVNALASVTVVLIGGILWGVPGMFLAIPITAVIKVICDRIPSLSHWGLLLGTKLPAGQGSRPKKGTLQKAG